MKRSFCVIILFCSLLPFGGKAQNSFDEFKKKAEREYTAFREASNQEFENFRAKANAEYAALIEKAWKELNALKGVPIPEEKPVPPVVFPDEDKDKPIKDNSRPFEEIVPIVKPEPQPQPIEPIEETPQPVATYLAFDFFGTNLKVRLDADKSRFSLRNCNEQSVADTWNKLSCFDNALSDCLAIRKDLKLCDWAYLLMLRNLARTVFNGQCNESELLLAYLYCQSGYKMRLATADGQLLMLFASRHTIYDKYCWEIDGDVFYALDSDADQVQICQASFPNEKPLSLLIPTIPTLNLQATQLRGLQSERYPEVKASVSENENLLKFFDTYPTSMLNEDFGTRWAMYANTPLSDHAKKTLYPQLKEVIAGKSQLAAVERLLNWVQTAFVYEYDDKVWGHDRAFFADETLYYPYCDCEDRSILFTRLVRDLLGLDAVLVFYPGHLASAIRFTDNVSGDYFAINGSRYVVCDPTFIGAPVGRTMPGMDNQSAKIILLR